MDLTPFMNPAPYNVYDVSNEKGGNDISLTVNVVYTFCAKS